MRRHESVIVVGVTLILAGSSLAGTTNAPHRQVRQVRGIVLTCYANGRIIPPARPGEHRPKNCKLVEH
jgi:hypothetical protein